MPSFNNSPLLAIIAAGLAAGCADSPTEARAPEREAEVQLAYSSEQLVTVFAGLEDASQRMVAGIRHDASAAAVQTAMAALSEELVINDAVRIRRAIDRAIEMVDRLAAAESAVEDAAELESVKLVLTNAALLLPAQFQPE